MAVTKEAIVIVLDVGRSMHHDTKGPQSILHNAKTCINMILQRKIFSESKDEIALVLFGTVDTSNSLYESGCAEYNHVTVVQELKPANWELLGFVNEIEGTDISADFIDGNALLVAMDLLQNTLNGKKFFSRRILFLSHFDESFCGDKVDQICENLKTFKIDLNLIGPISFFDEANNEIPEGQTPQIAVVQKILKEVNGESYSFSEALPALIYYQKKKVQALPWNANLDIGKNLTIPISAYTKVTEAKAKPWKNAYAHKLNAKIEKETSFHLNNEEQTEVPKDNIIPACRYGTTLVPFSNEDKTNMEYQSGEKGMKVLGFTKAENVRRYHYIGDKSMYIFGQKNRELAGVILAPFIQALHETKMVTIVRYVYSARSAPKIGFLAPRIKKDYECLVFVALPFMEDLRHFEFAPLDSNPKCLPTDEQLSAIDSLITSMDLSTAAVDEDGNRGEGLKPKNTVNPYLQRLYQCLQHRTFHPEKPLPEIAPHIKAIINPSPELLTRAEPDLKKIKEVFPLKEISEKKTVESGNTLFPNGESERAVKKRKSSDDIEEPAQKVLSAIGDKIVEVGSIQPVVDFKYLINHSDKKFRDICKQLENVVHRFLNDAMVTLHHGKIVNCVMEYRNASVMKQDPVMFNIFLEDIKNPLVAKHAELWKTFTGENVSLISSDDCQSSTVSPMEAQHFSSNVSVAVASVQNVKAMEVDDEDLLDQM